MGLSKKLSFSSYEKNVTNRQLPNPDPANFKIVKHKKCGNGLVIEIHYPDCTNFEGRKILVYEGIELDELIDQGSIDPHFCDNNRYYSPIARFEPTPHGWHLAIHIANML